MDSMASPSSQFKLRDSCHACASSKVKCSKDKPKCARCARRGTLCEYLVTKRPGRRHERRSTTASSEKSSSGSGSTTNANPNANANTAGLPTSLSLPGAEDYDFLASPDLVRASPGQGQHEPASTSSAVYSSFPNVLSSVDTSLSSMLTDLSTDFDSFFASPRAFPMPLDSNPDPLRQGHGQGHGHGQAQTQHHHHDDAVDSGMSDSSSSAVTISKGDSHPEAADTISVFGRPVSASASASEMSTAPDAPCRFPPADNQPRGPRSLFCGLASHGCCLVRALDLLKELIPADDDPTNDQQADGNGSKSRNRTLPTVQTVIERNTQTVEAITSMLQCSCLQDVQLPVIMSLIVFKVLDWYTAAAYPAGPDTSHSHTHTHPHSHSHSQAQTHVSTASRIPTVVAGGDAEEDFGLIAAQLVLGQLHRVQRFITQLALKLKGHGGQQQQQQQQHARAASMACHGAADKTGSPSSTTMLDQLEPELSRRLSTLSRAIINMLRRD